MFRVDESTGEAVAQEGMALPDPRKIKQYLDRHVIGQERAKKNFASDVFQHYSRLQINLPKSTNVEPSAVRHPLSELHHNLQTFSPHRPSHGSLRKQKPKKNPPNLIVPDEKPSGGSVTLQTDASYTDTDLDSKHLQHTNIRTNRPDEPIPTYLNSTGRKDNSLFPSKSEGGIGSDMRGMQAMNDPTLRVVIDKVNVLLIGPTGSGKTFIVQKIAEILDVPFASTDCTSLTQAGYVGDDIDVVLSKLYQNSGNDLDKTQRGIVYLDEVDKIARKPSFASYRDVGGEGVQQSLLKILEGTIVSVPVRPSRTSHSNRETVNIDTTNILFVASGAFSGLDKKIAKRRNKKLFGFGETESLDQPEDLESRALTSSASAPNMSSSTDLMGFEQRKTEDDEVQEMRELNELLQLTETRDVQSYGFLPEFVGRFPKIIVLHGLDENMLYDILTKKENNILLQKERIYQNFGVSLQFTDGAKRAIAKKALKERTGARSLLTIVERSLEDSNYWAPQSDIVEVVITEDVVNSSADPVYVRQADEQVSKGKAASGT